MLKDAIEFLKERLHIYYDTAPEEIIRGSYRIYASPEKGGCNKDYEYSIMDQIRTEVLTDIAEQREILFK